MHIIWKNNKLTGIETNKRETETESHKHEIVNGVRPLHWATSLGPSPMGTDPIIIF